MRFLILCSLIVLASACNKKTGANQDFETIAGIRKPEVVAPPEAPGAEAPAAESAAPAEGATVAEAAPAEGAAPAAEATAEAAAPSVEPMKVAPNADLEAGKRAYLAVCIQCHNKDPNKKGPIGPELIDAPLEIMEYKVANAVYPDVLPPGFVPKRKTKAMRKLPNSVKDVPNIHAWIQSVKGK